MATKVFPYAGESEGLKDFDESMTVQSELEGTKIGNILKKFQVTGVLPTVGRVALPADTFFGGEDFQSLSNKISEAREAGVTPEMLEGEVNEDESEHRDPDTDDSEHRSQGGVAAPSDGNAGE